jgi:hypothetical protein
LATVTYYESSVTISTYPYERYQSDAFDPVFNWPYRKFDLDRFLAEEPEPAPRRYRLLVLENEYLQVMVMPELGGRIWQVVHKPSGRQMFYQNNVVKPTAWGPEQQKGWLAVGGLEWGVPVAEHGYDWGVPWGYIPLQLDPQNAAIVVFTARDGRALNASITISLKAGEAAFEIEPTISNNSQEALRFDFWHSAMLPADAELHFLIPTNEMIIHSTGDPTLPQTGQRMSWPRYAGRNMSRLDNWKQYAGMFESPAAHGPAAAVYDAGADAGAVRIFPADIAIGSKIFAPGWSQPLHSSLYTDDGSIYVELHGGLSPTFAQQAFLQSGKSVVWREKWYPVNGIGMIGVASDTGALGAQRRGDDVQIDFYPLRDMKAVLVLRTDERELVRNTVQANPSEPYQATWTVPAMPASGLSLVLEDVNGDAIMTMPVE